MDIPTASLNATRWRRRDVSVFLGLTLICVACCVLSRAETEAPSMAKGQWSETPIWQLDLRPFGYGSASKIPMLPRYREAVERIFFTSDDVLTATFVTPVADTSPAVGSRPRRAAAWRLHAVFIEATTGRVRTTKEWPIASPKCQVLPVAGGALLLFAPDRLVLYSPDLEPAKELPLPAFKLTNEDIPKVLQSASRKTILLKYYSDENSVSSQGWFTGHYDFMWIDAQSLNVVLSWRQDAGENTWHGPEYVNALGGSVDTISDGEIAWGVNGAILIRRLDQPWRLICYLRPECSTPQFVSNENLLTFFNMRAFPKSDDAVAVLREDGSLLLKDQIACRENDLLGRPVVSADGRRFALLVYSEGGEIDFMDFHLRSARQTLRDVRVFDIPSRHWVYSLQAKKKIKGIAGDPFPLQGLALSPDGSQMAILTGDVLEVFRLPSSYSTPRTER